MKLVFKENPRDKGVAFENTLARHRYEQFWQENKAEILRAFYKHTGLRFKQKIITAYIWSEQKSAAGAGNIPMHLTRHIASEDELCVILTHELAHRLLMGYKIHPIDANQRIAYAYHIQIDLFLYDVWKDLRGPLFADNALQSEKQQGSAYAKAWKWALAKTYEQRQQSLWRLTKQFYSAR